MRAGQAPRAFGGSWVVAAHGQAAVAELMAPSGSRVGRSPIYVRQMKEIGPDPTSRVLHVTGRIRTDRCP